MEKSVVVVLFFRADLFFLLLCVLVRGNHLFCRNMPPFNVEHQKDCSFFCPPKKWPPFLSLSSAIKVLIIVSKEARNDDDDQEEGGPDVRILLPHLITKATQFHGNVWESTKVWAYTELLSCFGRFRKHPKVIGDNCFGKVFKGVAVRLLLVD